MSDKLAAGSPQEYASTIDDRLSVLFRGQSSNSGEQTTYIQESKFANEAMRSRDEHGRRGGGISEPGGFLTI